MKLNRKNKKAFTIVELVIVIGVIGILSAILIPTFANLTNKANDARAKEEVAGAYSLYVQDSIDGYFGDYEEMTPEQKAAARQIETVSQADAAIKRDGKWYLYGNNGWALTANGGTTKPDNVTEETTTPSVAFNDLFGEYNNCKVYNNKA